MLWMFLLGLIRIVNERRLTTFQLLWLLYQERQPLSERLWSGSNVSDRNEEDNVRSARNTPYATERSIKKCQYHLRHTNVIVAIILQNSSLGRCRFKVQHLTVREEVLSEGLGNWYDNIYYYMVSVRVWWDRLIRSISYSCYRGENWRGRVYARP